MKLTAWLALFTVAFLLVLPVSPVHPSTTPATVNAQPATPSASTSGLGPSVDLSYQVGNKCLWDDWYYYIDPVSGGSIEIYNALGWMLYDDGEEVYITHKSANEAGNFTHYLDFRVASPYTALINLHYDIAYLEIGGTLENDSLVLGIYRYTGAFSDTVTFSTSDGVSVSGNLTLSSNHVIDGYIFGRFSLNCWDNEDAVDAVQIIVDQLAFEYEPIEETRRSHYEVVGGTVRYLCDFTTWDYNVETTLTVPSAWTFQDVNPDCTESSGTFSCLVPEDYEAVYTLGALATANWQVFYEDGFEAGYAHNWTENLGTDRLDYVTVLDGQCSFYGKVSVNLQNIQCVVPTGNYQVMLSVFLVAGTAIRFYHYSTFWSYTSFTSTGEWETKLLNMTIGGPDGGRNIQISFEGATCEAYLDNFIMLNESISTGQTTTGTYNHIYPHGVVPASFFTMEYYIDGWHTSWTDLSVGSDGAWSLDIDQFSPTAGTKGFRTRNPDDTTNDLTMNYITYPWTVSVDTTLWMVFRRGTGQIIPWNTFICYVDNETRPEPYASITGSTTTGTSLTVNVTLVDDFGQLVYQNTSYPVNTTGHTFLRETLNVYVMNLVNQHVKPCYAVVERNGETFTSPAVGYLSSFAYQVYGSAEGVQYTVSWYRNEDDHLEETATWTVYQADINVYNGLQKPEVEVPPVGLDWLLWLIQGGFFWTTFIQLILIFAGLTFVGLWIRGKFPTRPTTHEPASRSRRSSTSLDFSVTPSEIEEIENEHDEAIKTGRKRRRRR